MTLPRHPRFARAGAATPVALMILATCSRDGARPPPGAPGERKPPAFPVAVVEVTTAAVEYAIHAVGTVEAFERVQVTARVPGVVERVAFREGDRVRADQVLVTIEPLRYRLAADAARAALEKAQAGRADAEAGLQRREAALAGSPGLIPGEEVATWRTRLRTAEAEIAAAQAALAQAELALRDAYVRAPQVGVIETRSVQTGQYVQPGEVLATLVRRDPLLVRFGVPPAEARRLTRGMPLAFEVQEADRPFAARITHVASAADPATRMVAVTAEVDRGAPTRRPGRPSSVAAEGDQDGPRPGAFAQVRVPLSGSGQRAPAVPETAVRPSEKGFVAFVVVDGRAVERRLQLGLRTADGRIEVRDGLAPGEILVVRGAEALRQGAQVVVERLGAAPVDDGAVPAGVVPGGDASTRNAQAARVPAGSP